MRRFSLGAALIGVASLGLGIASAQPEYERRRRALDDPDLDLDIKKTPKPKPKKPPRTAAPPIFRRAPIIRGSIAEANRHGGEHQHSREAQRRMRQMARRRDG